MKLKTALSKVAEGKQELNFYTDGSLDKAGNEELIPKMAAAWVNTETDIIASARVEGQISSTNLEIQAIILCLEAVPTNTKVVIHTDTQAAKNMAEKVISGEYKSWPARKRMKTPYWNLWDTVDTLAKKKKLTIQMIKVKAHTGIEYNEHADRAAKEALNHPKTTKLVRHKDNLSSFALAHGD